MGFDTCESAKQFGLKHECDLVSCLADSAFDGSEPAVNVVEARVMPRVCLGELEENISVLSEFGADFAKDREGE